jgi:hypothetical protein
MRFANPRSSGAQTTSFCRLIFFCALYLALPRVYATNGAAPGPESQLESLLHGTNLLARAFLKNDQIRFYSPAAAQWLAFQAEWKHSRAPAHEFKYASATLASHNPLPQLPNLSHWHEAQVLPSNDAARLFHSAADLLVPREPSHGVFCHYAFGDAVLFRDPSGKVQLSSGEEIPDDILIERRYNRQELAAAAATVLETNLLADYPNQTAFILPIGSGNQFRLALLDFTARNIVILYLPRKSDEPRLVSRLGLKLSNLVSLVLVDNAWTFLKNPVSASARTFHQWLEWPLTVITPRLRANRETIPPLTNASGMDLAAWERWLDQHTHTWRELGSLRLLIDGDGFFPILEHRIAEAQSNINFQVCIFDSDDIAVGIADQLKQLSTNLDIKIVFDRLMSRAAATSPPATPMPQGFTPPNSIATYLR